jgi:hypothetical protein
MVVSVRDATARKRVLDWNVDYLKNKPTATILIYGSTPNLASDVISMKIDGLREQVQLKN